LPESSESKKLAMPESSNTPPKPPGRPALVKARTASREANIYYVASREARTASGRLIYAGARKLMKAPGIATNLPGLAATRARHEEPEGR
jgi:hypothetical protein